MNLIVNDHKLDKQQEKAIYELTLKKKRNKKSTVSHKQMAAMQQLANELLAERIDTPQMIDCNYDYCIDCIDYYIDHNNSSHQLHHHNHNHHHDHDHEPPSQSQCQISNSSFISSTTSASTSSSTTTATTSSSSSTSIPDEAANKLNRLRLEQLNNELERRLHQYEYLVAQEKAILGTYNISLFAKESVNNFHLDLKR